MSALLAPAAVAALVVCGSLALRAQVGGSGTGLRYGLPDKPTLSYVSRCLRSTPPSPVELYSRGGWYVTDDLRQQFQERRGDIEGVAMVWKLKSLPRAVYQWNHDGEFNRDVVACLNTGGIGHGEPHVAGQWGAGPALDLRTHTRCVESYRRN